jgi:phage FluMu gp28-like protein
LDFYGEDAKEELFCEPRLSAGTYLPSILIESRMQDGIPVIRLTKPDEFSMEPEYKRESAITDWCHEVLRPLLDMLDPKLQSTFGADVARNGDLSVFWPFSIQQNLERKTPFVVELRNIPFKQQLQIAWYIIDRLPRFFHGAFDARGNGQQMAEETADRYGHQKISQVMTSAKWYLEAFPKYKAALEDATVILPKDNDIRNDHRVAVMIGGIPQIPEGRTKGADGGKRHGDSLVAALMAYWASLQDLVEYDYTPAYPERSNNHNKPDRDDAPTTGRFEHRSGAF